MAAVHKYEADPAFLTAAFTLIGQLAFVVANLKLIVQSGGTDRATADDDADTKNTTEASDENLKTTKNTTETNYDGNATKKTTALVCGIASAELSPNLGPQ